MAKECMIIIALSLFGTSCQSPSATHSVFVAKRLGFSFEYPMGWSADYDELKQNGVKILFPNSSDFDKLTRGMWISRTPSPKSIPEKELIKLATKLYQKDYPNGVVKGPHAVNINGNKMYEAIVEHGLAHAYVFRQKRIFWIKGEWTYWFGYLSTGLLAQPVTLGGMTRSEGRDALS